MNNPVLLSNNTSSKFIPEDRYISALSSSLLCGGLNSNPVLSASCLQNSSLPSSANGLSSFIQLNGESQVVSPKLFPLGSNEGPSSNILSSASRVNFKNPSELPSVSGVISSACEVHSPSQFFTVGGVTTPSLSCPTRALELPLPNQQGYCGEALKSSILPLSNDKVRPGELDSTCGIKRYQESPLRSGIPSLLDDFDDLGARPKFRSYAERSKVVLKYYVSEVDYKSRLIFCFGPHN